MLAGLLMACGATTGPVETTPVADPPPLSTPHDLAGVALAFDDCWESDWAAAAATFDPLYGWKATFFVTYPHMLTEANVASLTGPLAAGHEVGCHGLHHVSAATFLADHSVAEYKAQEVLPARNLLIAKLGVEITSYAHPHGTTTPELDLELAKQFKLIRGIGFTEGVLDPKFRVTPWLNQAVVGKGLDQINNVSSAGLNLALQAAYDENKVLLIYGHQPLPGTTTGYQMSYETLDQVCRFVKTHGMKFYRMQDLTGAQPSH
jgi:peptidoglycan/xylan/chitin deacetylase (PgdA/CDA1 family)